MGLGKKITLMVLGALALLLALGLADPRYGRLIPSQLEHLANRLGVASEPVVDKQAMHGAIVQFNRQLSAAYLALEPAALAAEPMADSLRRDYGAEIAFLKRQGRALEQTVQDIRIVEVTRLPDLTWSVNTVEAVTVRYINATDRTPITTYPASNYAMNYTLDKLSSGWKMVRVETRKMGKRDD